AFWCWRLVKAHMIGLSLETSLSPTRSITASPRPSAVATFCKATAQALQKIKARIAEPLKADSKLPGDFSIPNKVPASAVNSLVAALQDNRTNVRKTAARALGQTQDPRAITPLIAALGDEAAEVRLTAGLALTQIGPPAVELL